MKTLSIKSAVMARRQRDERMPPGSGLVIAAALSVMIWGIVAAAALLT